MQMSGRKRKKGDGALKKKQNHSAVEPPDLRAVASATECTGAVPALPSEHLTDERESD